jgi:hypothetical protein
MLYIALTSILWSLLANELFASQPWLTRMLVRLTARIDADHPDEINDIYAEHMAGINALPGHLTRLVAASGLLFKVAIARRVHQGAVAMRCRMRVRVGLMRAALARRRTAPTNPAPCLSDVDSKAEPTRTQVNGLLQSATLRGEDGQLAVHSLRMLVHRYPDNEYYRETLMFALMAHSEIAEALT